MHCQIINALTCGKGGWGTTYPWFMQNLLNNTASTETLLSEVIGVNIEGIISPEAPITMCSDASLKIKCIPYPYYNGQRS